MPQYTFVFPFKGKVKTQMMITKNRMVKPKAVKAFENQVRRVLADQFPLAFRPVKGYIKLVMIHYTYAKRDQEGFLIPIDPGDLDNLYKCLSDCFQPVYEKRTVMDAAGQPLWTPTGRPKTRYEKIVEGVIPNDKYIVEGIQRWIPIPETNVERIEVHLSVLTEDELWASEHER